METENINLNVGHSVSDIPKNKKIVFYLLGITVLFFIFYFLLLSAPKNFPIGAVVKVEPGMSLRRISSILKQEKLIRSRPIFESLVIIFGREKNIISADYFFEKKLPVFEIARRIGKGEHHMAPISVTIPEGFNTEEIGVIFDQQLTNFNKEKFLSAAHELEGYLFPDTYFFLTNADEQEVLQLMNENFEEKIESLRPAIAVSGQTEHDIIIMASIIEKEAQGDSDRKIISGILWKRILIGMPLQVDAAMETYKKKGLPEKPIGNPGLEAIQAALYPQKSPYLYYLHDPDGNIHYAKNFAEHVANKSKYLR
jgi:UPF0755 protein